MTLNEYQDAARRTAVYPESAAVIYPALKLAGEVGELAEKAIAYDAITASGEQGLALARQRVDLADGLIAEAGDCAWYVAVLAEDLGIHLVEMTEPGLAQDLLPSRGIPSFHAIFAAVRFGAASEAIGKVVRGDAGSVSPRELASTDRAFKYKVLRQLTAGWRELEQLAHDMGSNMGEVLALNLKKLADRQARGVLKGSGDNR